VHNADRQCARGFRNTVATSHVERPEDDMTDDESTPWTPPPEEGMKADPPLPPDPVLVAARALLRQTIEDDSAPLAVRVQAAAAILTADAAENIARAMGEHPGWL
jgi:hypothetical protein